MTYWLNEDARTFLSRGYLKENETAEQRIRHIAETAEKILGREGFADRVEKYILDGWCSLSSPIWANFGNERGLPISCNGSYIADTTESILGKAAEMGTMTKYGAGVSAYISALRSRGSYITGGGTSNGPVHFLGIYQEIIDVISQSNVRRGSGAFYMDVDHPDIEELLETREEGNHIQHLSIGVCIGDAWMNEMIAGDKNKRRVWARILRKRAETGYPYIFFKDAANRGKPEIYQRHGMTIWASNLCTEIMLPSTEDESFVCDLLSTNYLHYLSWKGTSFVQDMTWFLDAVLSEYVEKIKNIPFMQAAYKFAIRHRALGLGGLGWHSFLQSQNIAFESQEAKDYNKEIHAYLQAETLAASKEMAIVLGEPELLVGTGLRNTTLMAIAPTTSSSFILGQVSPSIEPENSNYYTKSLAKGKFTYKNPYLKARLAELGHDTDETWKAILVAGGSVQSLDILSEHDKNVFKTFGEISQYEIIVQAADRQAFIDQGQSLNLMIHPATPVKDVNKLMIEAWKLGLKSLYYQRSTSPTAELNRNLVACVSCEA